MSPISPRLVKRKNSLGESSSVGSNAGYRRYRRQLPVIRTLVFVRLAIVHCGDVPVTHQDQGLRDGPRGTVPSPWLIRAPENRRYPIVSNSLAVTLDRDDGLTVSWLVVLKTTPLLFWLTTEAYPPGNAGVTFGDVVPRCFPEGKSRHPLELRGTIFVIRDRRRRPNQEQWLEARHLSGLAVPSLMVHVLIRMPWRYRTSRHL